jgi:hypothetical protein
MNQIKKLKAKIPLSHPEAMSRIFNNPESMDGGLTKALDPVIKQDLTEQANLALEALKQGKKVQVLVPLCMAEKIRIDWLYVLGHEHQASAKLNKRQPAESVASLAKLLKETGFVCFADENGIPYSKKTNVIERVVEKEVKTIQTKASGIKEKDILKAIENTRHKMSKEWQFDVVNSVLTELRKQINI